MAKHALKLRNKLQLILNNYFYKDSISLKFIKIIHDDVNK